MKILQTTALFLFIFGLQNIIFAQTAVRKNLTQAEKSQIIEKALDLLGKNYVFPEVSKKIETTVRENLKKNEYEKINEADELAVRLTQDFQSVNKDQHLRIMYSPEILAPEPKEDYLPPREVIEQIKQNQARENFGIQKVEILKGNIGYINFKYFTSPEWAGEIYTGAMNFAANADALIIDLRENGGSMHPDAIPFLCSYFFADPVHLNDIYWRPANETRQFWTYAKVPGKRYLDKPIYILTSNRTFSGAEELAYDLKNLKRAVIIGERTRGGAHPGGSRRINDHFSIWLPVGRAINPVTHTNWEGTGVEPDFEVSSGKALYTAQLQAVKEISKSSKDDQWKQMLNDLSAELTGKLEGFKKTTFRLKGFENAKAVYLSGDFNGWSPRSISMKKAANQWVAEIEIEPGEHEYKFIVDGTWITDPKNPRVKNTGQFENSVLNVR